MGKYNVGAGLADLGDELVGASYYRLEADGDVLSGIYIVDEDDSNQLEIITIDTVARTVQGTFSVKFKQDPDDYNSNYPDKVEFKNGTFDVQIRE
jgi:hypothetical protein